MKKITSVLIFLVGMVLLTGALSWADGIKERMLQRQPTLLALKDKGVIGETASGYLGFVSSDRTGQNEVAGENQDRKAIYAHIAQQQNISVDLVAQRRGQQLIERTSPGHFFQDASGAWAKR